MKLRADASLGDQDCRQTPITLIETLHSLLPRLDVLVVASETRLRITLNVALRHQGFSVRLATSVEEAVELCGKHPTEFDAVVLDADMPGVDLPQAFQALRVVNPRARICLMAATDCGNREELARLRPACIFPKPLELEELALSLRSVATQPNEQSATIPEPSVLRPVAAQPPGPEKRAFVRYFCQLSVSCQPLGESGKGWEGRLRDISVGGASLLLDRRFEPGACLIIEFTSSTGDPSHSFVAHVVRVMQEPNGRWSLGCTFTQPLSEEDLRTLLS